MERRLTFTDLPEAKAVLGMKDEFLKTLQKEFPACQIVARGDEVIIIGDEPGISQVEEVIQMLRYLHRENTYMTTQHVRYSASLIRQGQGALLQSIYGDTVSISARGRLIKPKTAGQKQYVDSIRKNLVTFGIGPAGTGKTYLAVALASFYLKNREVERIILTRPAVEAGEKLGFLPGDLQEKIDPYLRPLYDALADMFGYDQFQKMVSRNIIEVAPLAYMRGRTLEESFIILDEAQNTTREQMKMFLTRMGNHSRVVVNGDITQIDLADRKLSGLTEAQRVLSNVRGIGMVQFTDEDVVRHDMVGRIIRAYEAFYKKQ
ncbi:MAG: PhoH family protein [Megasphaera sp.]|jgi:phosphate starvation-inducible PhoH-like protein|nr:PhoH family protein [Megasphaera sp.]MCH4187436.1 PhoH family protein [Megasphaera sp.]MCH4217355.1 PhoH family protein [Megasphaera sp.]